MRLTGKRRIAMMIGLACCVAGAMMVSAAGSETAAPEAEVSGNMLTEVSNSTQAEVSSSTQALVPTMMPEIRVEENPYLASGEALIHNDIYSSDVTKAVVPLGIYTELNEAAEQQGTQAPPCFFYDDYGNCITSLLGGVAIRVMDGDEVTTLGSFIPKRDDPDPEDPDSIPYVTQISYSFVDAQGNLVIPTNHGHLLMLKTTDENGTPLTVFEKQLDVDIVSIAKEQLGEDINDDLLSVIFDYDGNLWFVTGGFRIDPAVSADGFTGYLDREYIDQTLAGEELPAVEYVHCMRLSGGENAENGISAHPEGMVLLTNKNCMLLRAKEQEIETVWSVPYESAGLKTAPEGSGVTGIGLAWGGGSTPTLTNELAIFTDNAETVHLIAVDIHTGEVVAQTPVLETMGIPVSVDNSILAYSPDESRTTVLVCNWCGAGKAVIEDSSVQSYASIYDENWIATGQDGLLPGMERIDFIRLKDGTYETEKVWTREDIADTAMVKLSTATGYFYTYAQDPATGVWQFMALDYDTGETVYTWEVSGDAEYNNMAVGLIQGDTGNTLYCPTNNMVLVRIQDRFAYLPEQPEKALELNLMERYRMYSEEFQEETGTDLIPASYLCSAQADGLENAAVLAYRVNGLGGNRDELQLFVRDSEGVLVREEAWTLTDEQGAEATGELQEGTIYEVRLTVEDGNAYDLNPETGTVKSEMILAVPQE